MTLHLGKQPATPSPLDFKLADFLDVELVNAKPYAPHDTGFPLAMYGNGPDDTVRKGFQGAGDCVWAAFCELIHLWQHAAFRPLAPITGKEAIGAYSEFTGYRIGDDATDQGTSLATAMSQMRKTGLKDAKGTRHKIGAYLSITPGSSSQMQAAIRAFGAISIGINFPSYAMTEFNADKPWNYQTGGQIEGGHCIVASRPPVGTAWDVISWARRFHANTAFLSHLCDEAYAIIDPEFLNATGKTPEGLDAKALNAALAKL